MVRGLFWKRGKKDDDARTGEVGNEGLADSGDPKNNATDCDPNHSPPPRRGPGRYSWRNSVISPPRRKNGRWRNWRQ